MAEQKNNKLIKKEDYSSQLQIFEQGFLEVVRGCGLPTDNILVPVSGKI